MRDGVDIELVQKFHLFLMGGEAPDGFILPKRPRKMTAEQSSAVIYLLQEYLHVIPETYEMCDNCGWFFDSESEGHIPEEAGKMYCSSCDYLCKCKDCKAERKESRK